MSNKKENLDIETGTAKREEQIAKQLETKFEKKQLLMSKKYGQYRDLLDALLDNNKLYTTTEVEGLISNYRKGMVK
ncbi:MAG: hypothetical protein K1W19_11630 [Lachnospiraceae bacterium]